MKLLVEGGKHPLVVLGVFPQTATRDNSEPIPCSKINCKKCLKSNNYALLEGFSNSILGFKGEMFWQMFVWLTSPPPSESSPFPELFPGTITGLIFSM